MAGNSFLKLTSEKGPVKGESRQKPYDDQIEISDFSWEVTSDTSFTKGGGASVGKAVPGTCAWKHYFDTASPMILLNCVVGTHFKEIIATMCKSTGEKAPEEYFKMIMNNCFITKATIEAGEDGSVTQSVEMVFKEVYIDYKKQLDSGKLDSSPKSFTWNIPVMEAKAGG